MNEYYNDPFWGVRARAYDTKAHTCELCGHSVDQLHGIKQSGTEMAWLDNTPYHEACLKQVNKELTLETPDELFKREYSEPKQIELIEPTGEDNTKPFRDYLKKQMLEMHGVPDALVEEVDDIKDKRHRWNYVSEAKLRGGKWRWQDWAERVKAAGGTVYETSPPVTDSPWWEKPPAEWPDEISRSDRRDHVLSGLMGKLGYRYTKATAIWRRKPKAVDCDGKAIKVGDWVECNDENGTKIAGHVIGFPRLDSEKTDRVEVYFAVEPEVGALCWPFGQYAVRLLTPDDGYEASTGKVNRGIFAERHVALIELGQWRRCI